MRFFAVDVRLFGTVYIKASKPYKADHLLSQIRETSIDFKDRDWMSDATFENVPRLSFASSFTGDGPIPGALPVEVSKRQIELAQRDWVLGSRSFRMPFARYAADFEDMPVYSVDVDVTTTAFVAAETSDAASSVVAELKDYHIDFALSHGWWFSTVKFDDVDSDIPLTFSSNFYVVGPSDGLKLKQRWPG